MQEWICGCHFSHVISPWICKSSCRWFLVLVCCTRSGRRKREDDLAHGTSRWPFCPDGFRIPEGFGMVNQRDDTSSCHTPREVFETFRRHFGLYEEALNAMLLALLKVGRL